MKVSKGSEIGVRMYDRKMPFVVDVTASHVTRIEGFILVIHEGVTPGTGYAVTEISTGMKLPLLPEDTRNVAKAVTSAMKLITSDLEKFKATVSTCIAEYGAMNTQYTTI